MIAGSTSDNTASGGDILMTAGQGTAVGSTGGDITLISGQGANAAAECWPCAQHRHWAG